jgi:hypothetical protein
MRVVVALHVLLALAAVAASAQPAISFGEDEVVVTQLAPSSELALFSLSRVPAEWSSVLASGAVLLADEDGDGTVAHAVGGEVPVQSLWGAVDLSSGQFAVAWQDPFEPTEVGIDLAEALFAGGGAVPDSLLAAHASVELFLARPGVGAWHVRGSDGGTEDLGAPDDGAVLLGLAAAPPVEGTTEAFVAAMPGDVFVGIDAETFDFFAVGLAQ